ncbi:MAG TPA: type II toxin-antitoxin system VapC family toxin [Kofleriaceae bacterium]|nr:type II toxin-antitoxin system VapC family toxin [Kofleriaceae bacterium]
MRLAIDTNRYRDLCDGKRDVVERLETAEAIFVPFVVLSELRAGFAAGTKGRANERALHRFLAQAGVEVLHTTDATTRSYAALYRQLRTQGTPIPTNDLWIAAIVLEHDLALYSRDAHFQALPQLNLI